MTLRELRERTGLSQRQLAKEAGVHYTTVFFHETGKKDPTFKVLTREVEAAGGRLMLQLGERCYPFEVAGKGDEE